MFSMTFDKVTNAMIEELAKRARKNKKVYLIELINKLYLEL